MVALRGGGVMVYGPASLLGGAVVVVEVVLVASANRPRRWRIEEEVDEELVVAVLLAPSSPSSSSKTTIRSTGNGSTYFEPAMVFGNLHRPLCPPEPGGTLVELKHWLPGTHTTVHA